MRKLELPDQSWDADDAESVDTEKSAKPEAAAEDSSTYRHFHYGAV